MFCCFIFLWLSIHNTGSFAHTHDDEIAFARSQANPLSETFSFLFLWQGINNPPVWDLARSANFYSNEGSNLHRRTSILWSSDQIQLIKWGSVQHPNARISVRLKAWILCEYFGRVVNRQIKILWWPSAHNYLTIKRPPTASLFADSWLRPVAAPVVTV